METILAHIVTLEREINSAAFNGPSDLPRPTLFDTAEAASELNVALPAFIEKLRTAAVGPVTGAALATQTEPRESGTASSASPRVSVKINCSTLEEEIVRALDAGIRFTIAQQHVFEASCPGVASLFSSHGGGGVPTP
jgi:hypothetical protein